MSTAPIASGARAEPLMTAQPTVKTSPKVPMNSVTYLRIVTPAATRSRSPATDHSDTYSEHHLIRHLRTVRHIQLALSDVASSHHVRQHPSEQLKLVLLSSDAQSRDRGFLRQPGLRLGLTDRPDRRRRGVQPGASVRLRSQGDGVCAGRGGGAWG